jgi:hypothetical protein
MDFNNKKQIVSDIQRFLNISVDGIPGPITWRAIERIITGKNSSDDNTQRIKNIQQALKLTDDGKDGPLTWNVIKATVIKSPETPNPHTNKFSETIKLSRQTTGSFAQKIVPRAIVLHHTSGNYEGSVAWTSRIHNDKGQRLYASYHCIIARDGRRTITNEDTNRAYHAGKSSFNGRSGLNAWSLGVAWEKDTYTEPLSDAAIESALEYILPRMKKWNITPDWVTDHRTVSPGRKTDIAPVEFQKFIKILRKRYNENNF